MYAVLHHSCIPTAVRICRDLLYYCITAQTLEMLAETEMQKQQ